MLLGIIRKESNHLNRLLTDFLHYVRPQKFAPTLFDLAEAAMQTVNILRSDGFLDADLHTEYSFPGPLWVRCDETQIRDALWNIMRNAGEAMTSGGRLYLSGEAENGIVCLKIVDSGHGLSGEDLQRAFEPFYSNTPEGAGLGLAIARAAIERCGGRIWIENARNHESSSDSNEPPTIAVICGARVNIELPEQNPLAQNGETENGKNTETDLQIAESPASF
jgi:signal transduction histidine kinase